MVKKIRKRDGSVVPFVQEKITGAIWRAVKAVGGTDKEKPKYLSNLIYNGIEQKYGEKGIAEVEDVQDLVEKTLIEEGHAKVAKAYILYRKSREELRNVKGLFDTIEVIDDYVNLNDWMVKENSNMGFSLQGLNNYISTKIVSNYWMRRIYPEAIRKTHESSDLHVHDLGILGAYCVGWDLKDLLITGFTGAKGKVSSKPAKHFRTALGQMVNFFYTLQGETAGAQAFSNFDTLLAPFVRYDDLDYKQVKQAMQEFLFNMAVPTRVGFQTPFTNLTMDLKVPGYMKEEGVIIGGEMQKETYSDFQKEMNIVNKAFAECMIEGDAKGMVFTFPIPTYNITKDFDWDNPEYNLIWEMTAKYGIPYFSNFINSDMNPEDARSMCCRLRLDQKELRRKGGGLFGANPQTGSIGVVTINMPRIGFTAIDEEDFFKKLGNLMELAKESLEIKRTTIENFTLKGLYPYTKFYLRVVNQRFGKYWKNHFSTIGLVGLNEAILNFMPGENIGTELGKEFSIKVLEFMRERLEEYQVETGNIYNLEATPAEGTAYRFARSDKKRFGRIIVANEKAVRNQSAKPYYTNCVSQDTECLSIDGWKKYNQLKEGDLILTLNTNTKKLEYQPILYMNTQKIKNGDIYQIFSKRQNQLVTPNHRVLYDGNRKGKYQFATPENLPFRLIMPMAGDYSAFEIIKIPNNFVELIAWIITEGHFEKDNNAIRITQAEWYNKKNFDEIKKILDNLKIKYSILGDKRGKSIFRISAKNGKRIRKKINSKEIPRWCLNNLSKKQQMLLLNTMMKGDGSFSEHSSYYSTGNKKLADQFQELCIKCDKRAIISDYKKLCGAYHIVPSKYSHTEITKKNLKKTKYTGLVWCPTVENSTWVARREDKPFITGNSSQLPVDYTDDLFEALELQDDLQTEYTGGTVFHSFIGEKLPKEAVKKLVKKISEKFRLPYFTLTPIFSICPIHGYIAGEHKYCPKCDAERGYIPAIKQKISIEK